MNSFSSIFKDISRLSEHPFIRTALLCSLLTDGSYPPPYFMQTPFIAYSPFFQILSNLPPPSPPMFNPTALFNVLFLWLNGWSCHIWCVILLSRIMDLYMSSLGTLVPEVPYFVFYATRRQVYWGLTHNVFFCWYSESISHTQTQTSTQKHIAHSGINRMTHLYNYILTPPVTCSQ